MKRHSFFFFSLSLPDLDHVLGALDTFGPHRGVARKELGIREESGAPVILTLI